VTQELLLLLSTRCTKKVGEIILKCSKLFFKEVLHIRKGPHPDPLLKKRRGRKCENVSSCRKFFDILTIQKIHKRIEKNERKRRQKVTIAAKRDVLFSSKKDEKRVKIMQNLDIYLPMPAAGMFSNIIIWYYICFYNSHFNDTSLQFMTIYNIPFM
jgi:hypothetical protein